MSSTRIMSCSSVIWRDDYGYMTLDILYILLEGKEQVPNDVVDVLALMMWGDLLMNPLAYKSLSIVTHPLALAMQEL